MTNIYLSFHIILNKMNYAVVEWCIFKNDLNSAFF
jgi:hypothetical protein